MKKQTVLRNTLFALFIVFTDIFLILNQLASSPLQGNTQGEQLFHNSIITSNLVYYKRLDKFSEKRTQNYCISRPLRSLLLKTSEYPRVDTRGSPKRNYVRFANFVTVFHSFAAKKRRRIISAPPERFLASSQYQSGTKRPTGAVIGKRAAARFGSPAIGGGRHAREPGSTKSFSRSLNKAAPSGAPHSRIIRLPQRQSVSGSDF